ncbi:MAG: MarR family transcriptional regulator [Deltaproteobacteria bacterium]|nr:MarR family transcriptional regulator [Deltaproteobacteria bacterium]
MANIAKMTFSQAAQRFEDSAGQICRLYGVNPLLGRLYAVLFVATEPLSLTQLCEKMGTAKSTTSVVLRRLLSLRLVRRLPPRSDRKDYYEVVADLWSVWREWNQHWFQPEIAMWKRCAAEIKESLQAEDAPAAKSKEILNDRLSMLDEIAVLFNQFLGVFPENEPGGRQQSATVTIAIEQE